MNLESFVEAYTVTALVMFPILVFIIILLVRDLGKYSKLSEKIDSILKNLSEDLMIKVLEKNQRNLFSNISVDILIKNSYFDDVIENHICR